MKKYILISLIAFSNYNGYAQTKDTMWIASSKDYVVKSGVIYGIAGVKFDSSKFYYKKYLLYKNKGDTTNAKKIKLLLQKYKRS